VDKTELTMAVEGDIINLDVTLCKYLKSRKYVVLSRRLILVDYGGFHGDLNATYPVGKVDEESADLMATTKAATDAAIAICKPGLAFREIGNKIEEVVKPKGYGIVRRYTGHGIHNLVSREGFGSWRSGYGSWFQNQRGMRSRSGRQALTWTVPLSAKHRPLRRVEDAGSHGSWPGLHNSEQ
jgi:hypothetical protein